MTETDATPLSLIIPVYDSARFIEGNLRLALEYLEGHPGAELIVIDDCSHDETPAIVERLVQEVGAPRLRLLRNDENRGKGFSVRRAMLEAKGSRRVFYDGGFTYPIRYVSSIIDALDRGADVAVACRVHRDSEYVVQARFLPMLLTRHLMSRVFNFAVRALIVRGARDTQAGLKGFTAAAAEQVFPLQTMNRFSFDLEILFIAVRKKLSIEEVGVEFQYQSALSTTRVLSDALRMIGDMGRIRWNGWRGRYDD